MSDAERIDGKPTRIVIGTPLSQTNPDLTAFRTIRPDASVWDFPWNEAIEAGDSEAIEQAGRQAREISHAKDSSATGS